jgi:hypothetical protein
MKLVVVDDVDKAASEAVDNGITDVLLILLLMLLVMC